MAQCAVKLRERLEAGAAGPAAPPVNIWRALGDMTLQVVGTTAFGIDFRTLEGSPEGRRLAEGAAAAGTISPLCPCAA